ncbi:hypothetical protein [Sphingomonas astaxanthinifaciens]|uniref:hypothetical protein n=1 Tax=Sphingomonas astaxanthinifaciens TaxID=407019 RepID=UPI00068C26EF|nr:hypothetical protein [Sphingomonas astaxanthinifaciens]
MAAAALALPALAQESLLPPGFNDTAPPPEKPAETRAPDSGAAEVRRPARPDRGVEGGVVEETSSLSEADLKSVPVAAPPVELPASSERDPRVVGAIDPVSWGLGASPWGPANGGFLSGLMRRLDTPLPSRWLHITLRNALLSRSEAPPEVNPVDWVAERAWLLLRMGEADAAAMLVAGVDVSDFTPKMTQVAVQSALASADPGALCPVRDKMQRVEKRILALTDAMCAALSGEASSAATRIEQARRRGPITGIDHVLADKVVGAGADTGRAATVEWEGVKGLTAWRFGLASATGLVPPANLINRAPPRVRAWQARAPLLSAEQRLPSARIATGLGVLSSASLVDLYSQVYDGTDPSDLSGTDAWQLRLAFAAREPTEKVAAMRKLWGEGNDPLQRLASEALVSLAASRVRPDASYGADVPRLIASMLAGGYDRAAGRWAGVVGDLDDSADEDKAWALLALGTEANVDLSEGRIEQFVDRDSSPDQTRSKLLVAGLAGLGRINSETATSLNRKYALGLGRENVWTRIVTRAGEKRQPGSAVLLAAIGMQAAEPQRIPSAHVFRALTAMRGAGLDFAARMVAAEMLSRT